MKKLSTVLVILFLAVWPFGEILAETKVGKEKQSASPHVIHAGVGYSYVPSVYVAGSSNSNMDVGSIRHGIGFEAGYEYLFRRSWLSLGVMYTGHYGGGMIGRQLWDLLVHDFMPTVGGHWSWGKHTLKPSIGLGYLCYQAIGPRDFRFPTGRLTETDGGFSSYFSLEYEYRFSPDTGLFVRLHEMDWVKDMSEDSWEGIVGYGVAVGFNLHF